MKKDFKFREIPYNYTSFSDKEIILRYFDQETWEIMNNLGQKRVTGRSARLLTENIGDMFIIDRNPYIFDDYLDNPRKLNRLKKLHAMRFKAIEHTAARKELVHKLIEKCREVDEGFFGQFGKTEKARRRILSDLEHATSRDNIHFSPVHRAAHVTDASDWRVEYPVGVVYPNSAGEVIDLIDRARKAGLKIIPRGGGTGLTGGAVPVYPDTLVINTEKLNRIGDIEYINVLGNTVPVISVEAGAVTENVIEHCMEHGLIFATDPTSAWASTIGGNIAENAGGKKCVMWGTAIDNLYSLKLANPFGGVLEVLRRNHPHRKIMPEDEVIFDVYDASCKTGKLLNTISLRGDEIRKKGLGKDITNKSLGGVPGIQKEGGDGIILSAEFVLYEPFKFCKTVCLEFFGNNLINASRAIVDIIGLFEREEGAHLTALEHFDEKYVSAINYRNRSHRNESPKAVLLVDIESNSESELEESCSAVIRLVGPYNTEATVASTEAQRKDFWNDRKNLGAIARHTNAFKLNEDIVIPIQKLPQFADFIEKLNIIKELENNLWIITETQLFLAESHKLNPDEWLTARINSFLNLARHLKAEYNEYIMHMDSPARELFKYNSEFSNEQRTLFELMQEGAVKISFNEQFIDFFQQTFKGHEESLAGDFNIIVETQRKRKIIVATHMHAGDGNVHVNIPVHSNDYLMMMEADETAGTIMKEAVRLGGVVSGEHGIGLTKLRFIEKETLERYAEYKKGADPEDLFNPGKLRSDFPQSHIYTPSINLLELEAFILKAVDLEKISTSIAACVRCGKCKSVCNTHYPEGTMFYNPRNKILGVTLIMEAVLFEAQTSNSLSLKLFKKLREISDHCTVCHKCQGPCPVKIDFGNVTLSVRDLLVSRKKAKFKMITSFTLFYLKRRGYYYNKLFRLLLLRAGYSAQRTGYYFNKLFFNRLTRVLVPKINEILKSKLPAAGKKTLRETVKLKGEASFIAFVNPERELTGSVVYFPGCGSERMFSDISFASVALLYYAGKRVVLPPEYLCCGYPLLANGKIDQAEMKSYENRVILHRMGGMIGYMDISHVLVSCGTCYEMLEKYEVGNIFDKAKPMDINEFLAQKKLYAPGPEGGDLILYHDPCHTPLKQGFNHTFMTLLGSKPVPVPYCCGEGGTLALSTPDISNTLRERKANAVNYLSGCGRTTLLTTCPSCRQGLSRIHNRNYEVDTLTVYLAEKFLGHGWKKRFITDIRNGGYEKILL
jgi:FAD/FMN-containing dehydrogenase/Fe-S oxidoreductase